MQALRIRFWVETVAGITSALLAVLTIFVRDWIEVTGWDPDNHSGAAEWWVVGCLAFVSAASAVAAMFEWRHAAAVS